jgi:hypothetical protein
MVNQQIQCEILNILMSNSDLGNLKIYKSDVL